MKITIRQARRFMDHPAVWEVLSLMHLIVCLVLVLDRSTVALVVGLWYAAAALCFYITSQRRREA